ncbi:MAG: NACHT domain-containing protein [Pseudomonadota bacterium]
MKHFQDILTTLGAKPTLLEASAHWDYWSAEFTTPVATIIGHYLYLKHDCPQREASQVNLQTWRGYAQKSHNKTYLVVVTPKSDLAKNPSTTERNFKGNVTTSQQLLLQNFLSDLHWKPFDVDEYFVEPSLFLPDGELKPAKSFLTSWLVDNQSNEFTNLSSLAVLTANAGVGKTTLSRAICSSIKNRYPETLPILIESDLWRNLLDSNLTFESVLDLALSKRFENAGKLMSNKTALQVLIREGLLVVVFDGFDELYANQTSFTAKEVIDKLIELLIPEDTRCTAHILLTTRETYWKNVCEDIDPEKISIFKLRAFDQEQKKTYFNNRLKSSVEVNTALRISKDVGGGIFDGALQEEENADRISGVPFILDLIACYVNDNNDINPYQVNTLGLLFEGVCRRENIRQQLTLEATDQLTFFEEIFREYPDGFTKDDIRLYLEIICHLTNADTQTRFLSHAFLKRTSENKYGPRYEILKVYFLARYLVNGLIDNNENRTRWANLAQLLALNSTGKTQIMDLVVEQIKQHDSRSIKLAFTHAINIAKDKNSLDYKNKALLAISNLAIRTINAHEKQERTSQLIDLVGLTGTNNERSIIGMFFGESMRGYDLSNIKFKDCTFVDVEFRNCIFSDQTEFNQCTFSNNLTFSNCTNPEELTLSGECHFSKEAEYILNRVLGRKTKYETKIALAEDALTRALKKFKGNFGFSDIQYRHRKTGFKPGNPYNDRIWEGLLNEKLVLPHEISNVSDGGLHITEDKVLRREISSYLDNGIIGQHLRQIISSLVD